MSHVRVPSTAAVELSVDLLGGSGPPLLIAHATGFCGGAYRPLARHLRPRFACITWDFRGHGDSTPPADGVFHWDGFADDVMAVVDALPDLTAGTDRPVYGFGHSKGGAALLLAEQRRPGTFAGLYLFEPVVFPPAMVEMLPDEHPLAQGARRRRPSFPTAQDAIDNYASKPPLDELSAESLAAYVEHGFTADAGGVTLKCLPENEARMFEMGPRHRAWDRLPEVTCPVLIAAGADRGFGPGSAAAQIADRIPAAEFVRFDDLGHFGPLADEARIATDIIEFLGP